MRSAPSWHEVLGQHAQAVVADLEVYLDDVVRVVELGDAAAGVDRHPQQIGARRNARDVDPLTLQLGAVVVGAALADALSVAVEGATVQLAFELPGLRIADAETILHAGEHA